MKPMTWEEFLGSNNVDEEHIKVCAGCRDDFKARYERYVSEIETEPETFALVDDPEFVVWLAGLGYSIGDFQSNVVIRRSMARRWKRNDKERISITELLKQGEGVEQIEADDPRLAKFWQAAADLADAAGYCDTFDAISEGLGGPRRDAR